MNKDESKGLLWCLYCGKKKHSKSSKAQFCSTKCRVAWYRLNKDYVQIYYVRALDRNDAENKIEDYVISKGLERRQLHIQIVADRLVAIWKRKS